MNDRFLIRIDDAKFADLPNKVVPRTVRLKDPTFESRQAKEWIFGGYCEKLLYKNERLAELLQQFVGRMDDRECWHRLTQGQRILYSLAALDGQVKNGGITQFFWNCPDLIFPASDALAALNYPDLSAAFEKALESLIGKKVQWVELRNQSSGDQGNFWEPFQTTNDTAIDPRATGAYVVEFTSEKEAEDAFRAIDFQGGYTVTATVAGLVDQSLVGRDGEGVPQIAIAKVTVPLLVFPTYKAGQGNKGKG